MSCATPEQKWSDPIAPGAALLYEIDASWVLARKWEPKEWTIGDKIRLQNGFDAECIVAGRSGPAEPRWTAVLGDEPADGSAQWRLITPTSASLRTTATGFTWACPTGITGSGGADSQVGSSRKLTVASDVAPGDYVITITMACANTESEVLRCTLQVR
jgi:hypothetical protein